MRVVIIRIVMRSCRCGRRDERNDLKKHKVRTCQYENCTRDRSDIQDAMKIDRSIENNPPEYLATQLQLWDDSTPGTIRTTEIIGADHRVLPQDQVVNASDSPGFMNCAELNSLELDRSLLYYISSTFHILPTLDSVAWQTQ